MKPAIVLVDHGSRRPEANATLEEVAELLRAAAPERLVRIAHMELEPPSLAEAIAACAAEGAAEVTVHPYFLAPGSHSRGDIPRLAALAAEPHDGLRVRVSEPLGADVVLARLVLARVEEAERD